MSQSHWWVFMHVYKNDVYEIFYALTGGLFQAFFFFFCKRLNIWLN